MLSDLQCADLNKSCSDNKECLSLNSGNAICSEKGRCIVSPKVGKDGKGCFADMWTGIGFWGNINRFRNDSSLSEGSAATVAALQKITRYDFLGYYENSIQPAICALYGTKHGCTAPKCYSGSDSGSRFGCVGYRKGAVKIYVQAGDEANYSETNWNVADASKWGAMLKQEKVRYVGLWGTIAARDQGIKQMACYAGSCPTGNCAANCGSPTDAELANLYVDQLTNTNIHTVTRQTLLDLAKEKTLQITTEKADIDANASKLVQKLVLNKTGATVQGRKCTSIANTISPTGDLPGIKDLLPGTSVCYDVYPVQNQSIFPATTEPQVKKARIYVKGDGSVLNSGIAYFLIPPVIEGPNT